MRLSGNRHESSNLSVSAKIRIAVLTKMAILFLCLETIVFLFVLFFLPVLLAQEGVIFHRCTDVSVTHNEK